GPLDTVADGVGPAGPAGGRRPRRGNPTGRCLSRGRPAARRHVGRARVHGHRLPRGLLHQLPPVPAGVPGHGPRPVRRGWRVRLTVAAPLRIEARLIGWGGHDAEVVRTGMGPRRATATAITLDPDGAVAVVGFGGG